MNQDPDSNADLQDVAATLFAEILVAHWEEVSKRGNPVATGESPCSDDRALPPKPESR